MFQLQYIVSNINWMKSGGAHVGISCFSNPGLLYTMHTLRYHMILMHGQQNPLTTSNYILEKIYLPKQLLIQIFCRNLNFLILCLMTMTFFTMTMTMNFLTLTLIQALANTKYQTLKEKKFTMFKTANRIGVTATSGWSLFHSVQLIRRLLGSTF